MPQMTVSPLVGRFAAAALFLLGGVVFAEDAQVEARRFLEESGVQGGVVVLLGHGSGESLVELHATDSYIVQGLFFDAATVDRARATLRAAGLYGSVSAELYTGSTLPYTDNFVNLLVVESQGSVPQSEILRVLVPGGVACQKQRGEWITTVKPRPAGMDEWTHYLHAPDGNAVSQDEELDFLQQLQWVGGPRYGRHHDHMSSASAMVSAGGRVFAIFDHASPFSIQLPSKFQLVARDAFNGVVLWRREVGPWFSQMQRLKSGPSDLPRRLVALGDTVYVTLALDAPVSALAAATGETLKTYAQTKGADEILCLDDVLYLVVNRQGFASGPLTAWTPQQRTVMAVNTTTGETLWQKQWSWVVPGCLAVGGGRVVFFDGERVVALDQQTGAEQWRSEPLGDPSKPVPVYFSPTLVLYQDLVLFSGADPDTSAYHADNGQTMYCFSADTGKTLWQAPHPPSGYRSAEDILVAGGLVWTEDVFNSKEFRTEQTGTVWGRDPRTGEVKVTFKPDVETHWFHHRCYRAKATEKYLLTSRTGIEFVDLEKRHWTCHHWVRGACLYGIMPANGMIYNPPHPCACYLESKLYGFTALSGKSAARQSIIDAALRTERLERGPAYGAPLGPATAAAGADWPTLRADASRSGRSAATVATAPAMQWETKLGGRLSSLVAAEGKLFVADIDGHQVHALDATTGAPVWQFTAGARVDSPPTVWRGTVLFGSADGYVYALQAADGKLRWRFRAAPADLRLGAFEQVESVWPVSGSVLVFEPAPGKPELWCVAGRSMFVDGGMRLVRLNPETGALLGEKVLDDRVPGTEDNLQTVMNGLNMAVAQPDVLVSDGRYVYMKSQPFDLEGNRLDLDLPTRQAREQKGETAHLLCPTGLLDDVWWHRSYWLYGRVWKSGAGGYYQSGRFAPAGRPLVFDDTTAYSFGRKPQYYRWTTPMEYMLYASAKQPQTVKLKTGPNKGKLGSLPPNTIRTQWQEDVPLLIRAMVLTPTALFVAGPPALIDEKQTLKTFTDDATQQLLARQAAALEGAEGALLWAVSPTDGKKLAEQRLKGLPVFDGLIAAGNRLYFATTDGRVIAME